MTVSPIRCARTGARLGRERPSLRHELARRSEQLRDCVNHYIFVTTAQLVRKTSDAIV